MAMKKAEMEAHSAAYREKLNHALAAESEGLYREALDAAVSAWEHIDAMMQYERKYQGAEFTTIPAIDLALKYAPLLLDLSRLNELDELLSAYKRIDKFASDDIQARVEQAKLQIWENHRLWSHVSQNPGVLQEDLSTALGGSQQRWRSVAESWAHMGLLARTPAGRTYRLALSTRMGEITRGKCPSCGHVAEAPKGMFLEQMACPECRERVVFVLLADQPAAIQG